MPSLFFMVSDGESGEQIIPDYQLLRCIGRGGYGEVWLARSLTGLYRAVKIVWRQKFADARPYEREFSAIVRYSAISRQDPRLIDILHVGKNDSAGCFFYIMELADDMVSRANDNIPQEFNVESYRPRTLKAEIESRGRLPVQEVIQLGVEMSKGLGSLHRCGLVHRDIKPSNIIFVGGIPKLADVGLVTEIRNDVTFIGTEGFVPPEGPGKPSADVFALGRVLYELATGNLPTEFPRLPVDSSDLLKEDRWLELNSILLKAGEPNARQRYPSTDELLKDLLLVEAGSSVRLWHQLRRQTKWLKVAAAFLALLVVGTLSIVAAQRRLTRQQSEGLNRARYTNAQMELRAGRYARARDVLREIWSGPPEKGPLEWRILYRDAFGQPNRVYSGADRAIRKLAMSPDGETVVALSSAERLWVWERGATNSSKQVFGATGLGTMINNQTMPPWVKRLTNDAGFQLIHPKLSVTNKNTKIGQCHGDKLLLSLDRSLHQYEIRSGPDLRLERVIRIPTNTEFVQVREPTLSNDGRTLFVQRFTKPLNNKYRWRLDRIDVMTGKVLGTWPVEHAYSSFDISSDGRYAGMANSTVGPPQILNLHSNRWTNLQATDGSFGAESIVFEPNGTRVATGGSDGMIRIWEIGSGRLLETLVGHSPSIRALYWSGTGNWLVSGDDVGEVRRWRVEPQHVAGLWKNELGNFALGNESTALAASYHTEQVAVWRGPWRHIPDFQLKGSFEPIRFSDHDRKLWTFDHDGSVIYWDLESQKALIRSRPLVETDGRCAKVVVDERRGIAVALDMVHGQLVGWDLNRDRLIAKVKFETSFAYLLEISADGRFVTSIGSDESIGCWRTEDLALLWSVPSEQGIGDASGIAISGDGKWVAAGTERGEVRLYRANSGELKHVFKQHFSAVLALTFSPDGKVLVSSHTGGQMAWFDLLKGFELTTLRAELQPVKEGSPSWRLQFSKHSSQLVGLNNTSEIRRWIPWWID